MEKHHALSLPSFPSVRCGALFLLAALFFFAVTALGHENFSNGVVVPFKNTVGPLVTEYVFLGTAVAGVAGMIWTARRHGVFNRHSAAAWLALLVLAAAGTRWLMVTRIEMIHYPQYALLGLLLRLGGLSPGAAYTAGTAGNFLDEGRQYFLHPRYTGYFDWNDILVNTIGLCMGLLLAQRTASIPSRSRIALMLGGGLLLCLAVTCGFGLYLGRVIFYCPTPLDAAPTAFPVLEGMRVAALSLKTPPLPLWEHGPWGDFHIIDVVEGFILIPPLVFLLYKTCTLCSEPTCGRRHSKKTTKSYLKKFFISLF